MSNRIREHRIRLGWSQERLATEAGTSTQQISRLEKSQRGLDDVWLERLAGAMGISKAAILTDAFGIPGRTPRDGDFIKDDIERTLLDFWRRLSPEAQDVVLDMVNAWVDRTSKRAGRL